MSQQINTAMITDFIATHYKSKREFCKQCNMSPSTLSRILSGKNFNLIFLFRIARGMNVALHELFVPCV